MPHDQAYLEAEQKIQQALQSGATELDLSGMKLTELPESIGQLTQLTKLDLSFNQLNSLPDSLEQLTHLKNLYSFWCESAETREKPGLRNSFAPC